MHKNMQEVKSKDWKKMQEYFNWNKNDYVQALRAMEEKKEIDFQKMFLEDPELFVFFVNIYTENDKGYDVNHFWSLRNQAYQHLKKDGLFKLDITSKKLELVKSFEDKLMGIPLIPKDELQGTMTIKNKKNELSVHFDYIEVSDLIEKYYEIEVRSVFQKLKHEMIKEIYGKYFSLENYEEISRTSPVNSLEANYLRIISDLVYEKIEYIDFWHHMIAYDFSDVSNGGLASMWEAEESELILEDVINIKKFQDYISNQIKKVFFKELRQLDEVEIVNKIDFLIEW